MYSTEYSSQPYSRHFTPIPLQPSSYHPYPPRQKKHILQVQSKIQPQSFLVGVKGMRWMPNTLQMMTEQTVNQKRCPEELIYNCQLQHLQPQSYLVGGKRISNTLQMMTEQTVNQKRCPEGLIYNCQLQNSQPPSYSVGGQRIPNNLRMAPEQTSNHCSKWRTYHCQSQTYSTSSYHPRTVPTPSFQFTRNNIRYMSMDYLNPQNNMKALYQLLVIMPNQFSTIGTIVTIKTRVCRINKALKNELNTATDKKAKCNAQLKIVTFFQTLSIVEKSANLLPDSLKPAIKDIRLYNNYGKRKYKDYQGLCDDTLFNKISSKDNTMIQTLLNGKSKPYIRKKNQLYIFINKYHNKRWGVLNERGHGISKRARDVICIYSDGSIELLANLKMKVESWNNLYDVFKETTILEGLQHPYLPQKKIVAHYEGKNHNLSILTALGIPYLPQKKIVAHYEGKNHNLSILTALGIPYSCFSRKAVYEYQISEGLAYLNNQKVIHNDIKCNNILVCKETGNIKIIDYGLSINPQRGLFCKPQCLGGTYPSPECFLVRTGDIKIEAFEHFMKIDPWAWACTIVQSIPVINQMCNVNYYYSVPTQTNTYLFQYYIRVAINQVLCKSQYPQDRVFGDLLMKCFDVPEKRLTMSGILAHPYWNMYNTSTV